MQRSSTFLSPGRKALLDHPYAHLQDNKTNGPVSWLNPTRARFDIAPPLKQAEGALQSPDGTSADDAARTVQPKIEGAQVEWRARDNRKGRHILIVPHDAPNSDSPPLSSSFSAVARGIWRMCTVFAWWDVSWWIAVLFTVGCAIFVASACFYWVPLVNPATTFPGEATVAGGVTSFVGATLFQIGAILLIVEACNENQSGCFGWAVEQAFQHPTTSSSNSEPKQQSTATTTAFDKDQCTHHHTSGLHKRSVVQLQHPAAGRRWEWWPTMQELRTHYLHEIGFLASLVMTLGATIFYISGIMVLPGIYNHLSQPVLWGVYWLAYLLGGVLFVVSSALYMLETQPNWYTPAPRLIGWWIGVWNMIGSVGWTLSASFGYCSASWCGYQSDLTLLWASAAFMIGSALLWYESLDKYVVERERK